MAEEAPAVQNKGMLVVAIVLGLAAVIVYNWQVTAIRSEARGAQVTILRFDREMGPGDRIDVDKDLTQQDVSKRLADGLGDVVVIRSEEEKKMFRGTALNRKVYKGQWLASSMVTSMSKPPPSQDIPEGYVGVPVPINLAIPDILRPGDRVNLTARIPIREVKGGKEEIRFSEEVVVEDVKVLTVGSRGARDMTVSSRVEEEGATSYRAISIALKPLEARVLKGILTHVSGGLEVELMPFNAPPSAKAGEVNRELAKKLDSGGAPPRSVSPLG